MSLMHISVDATIQNCYWQLYMQVTARSSRLISSTGTLYEPNARICGCNVHTELLMAVVGDCMVKQLCERPPL